MKLLLLTILAFVSAFISPVDAKSIAIPVFIGDYWWVSVIILGLSVLCCCCKYCASRSDDDSTEAALVKAQQSPYPNPYNNNAQEPGAVTSYPYCNYATALGLLPNEEQETSIQIPKYGNPTPYPVQPPPPYPNPYNNNGQPPGSVTFQQYYNYNAGGLLPNGQNETSYFMKKQNYEQSKPYPVQP
jgi:hypothetical protein